MIVIAGEVDGIQTIVGMARSQVRERQCNICVQMTKFIGVERTNLEPIWKNHCER